MTAPGSPPRRASTVEVTPRLVALVLLALLGILFWVSAGSDRAGGGRASTGAAPAAMVTLTGAA